MLKTEKANVSEKYHLYVIIGSNSKNPWFILDYVTARDEWEADAEALRRYGYGGYRTVQKADKR